MHDNGRRAEFRRTVGESEHHLQHAASERLDDVDDGPAAQYTTDRDRITAGIVWSISLRSRQGDQFVTYR